MPAGTVASSGRLLLSIAVAAAGCATPRSDTQALASGASRATLSGSPELRYPAEQVIARYFDELTPARRPQVAAIATEAIALAVQLVGYLINQEAKNYEASYGASTDPVRVAILRAPDRASTRTVEQPLRHGGLVFLRTVRAHGFDPGGLATDRALLGLPRLVDTRDGVETHLAAALNVAPGSVKAQLDELLDSAAGKRADGTPPSRDYVLTFAAVVLLERERLIDAAEPPWFRMRLGGLYYAALKAKNLATPPGMSLFGWEKTDTRLAVRLAGPSGERNYAEQQFHADAAFDITWTREIDPAKLAPPNSIWQITATPTRSTISRPIRAPNFTTGFVWTANVVESSDMEKTLQDLAKRVDAIKVK